MSFLFFSRVRSFLFSILTTNDNTQKGRRRDRRLSLSSFFFCHLVLKMKLCPYDENTKSGRKKVKHPKFTFKDTHFFTSIRS